MNNFKKTTLLASVIFLAILVFAFFFLYRYVNSNNEKARQATTELQNEIILENETKLLSNSVKAIEEDRAKLAAHFVNSSNIVRFLDTIEALAPRAGAQAETTSVDILKDQSGLAVKLKVLGSFKSIYGFLVLLENSQYELEFTNINIQKEGGEEVVADDPAQAPSWQADFGIKLLSFIP